MIKLFELNYDRLGLRHRVHAVVEWSRVHHVQQHTGALQMAQKLMAQTRAFRRPFDQARHIGHHKTLLWRHTHHTQIGVQGGERVVSDFGPGVGDGCNQGGLARVGHAQQTHIGQHLQLQLERVPLAHPARRFLPGRAVGRTFVVHVAETTVAPFGQGDLLAGHQQLMQHLAGFGVGNDGAHRHLEHDVIALDAEHIGALAVFAAVRFKTAVEPKINQRVQAGVGHREYVPATATVAAIRTAKFFVFLVPE